MSENASPAQLTFIPWLRRGMASAIAEPAVNGAPTRGEASIAAGATLNGTPIEQTITLHGPGDVTGIDPAQIVRVEPELQTGDFEPNLFPFVEFAAPDFPWLFTPAAPDDQGRLRPWLVLAVVEEGDEVELIGGGDRLPVLSAPAEQLPPLAESWGWAHVQATASFDDAQSLAHAIRTQPEGFVSRIICPRRLEPGRSYLACLVPAFKQGADRGLGQEPNLADGAADAWSSGDARAVLPIYFSWRFQTGPRGDFESLAERLHAPADPTVVAGIGVTGLDVGDAGAGMPQAPADGAATTFKGALASTTSAGPIWDAQHRQQFEQALEGHLFAAQSSSKEPDRYDPLKDDPVVTAPIYGGGHSGLAERNNDADLTPSDAPLWLRTLNLDPAHRAVAGLGAEAVRRDQEALMASAWRQAASLEEINRNLRQARLAAEVGAVIAERVKSLDDDNLVQLTSTMHRRIRVESTNVAVSTLIDQSELPRGLVGATLRRKSRRGGTVAKALRAPQAVSAAMTKRYVQDPGSIWVLSAPVLPAGTHATNQAMADGVASAIDAIESPVSDGKGGNITLPWIQTGSPVTGFARAAGSTTNPYIDPTGGLVGGSPGQPAAPTGPSSVVGVAGELRDSLDPHAAVAARLRSRIDAPAEAWRGKQLPRGLYAQPEFADPAVDRLVAQSTRFLLPGIEGVPDDSVVLLEINRAFIEAFLVGMNDEMSREFLWREYLADLRGTWFSRFWDWGDGAEVEDIEPIAGWNAAGNLGEQGAPGASASLALLIKGELLRRYPDLNIYAVRAGWDGGSRVAVADELQMPLFEGALGNGVRYYGFDLSTAQARGSTDPAQDAGWFFVFEENPDAPRFGLEVVDPESHGSTPSSADELDWGHTAASESEFAQLTHAPLTQSPLNGVTLGEDEWGAGAAEMACITLQTPFRMLIHADYLLGN